MTSWTAAHQAPLSFTVSWSLLRFMSIESVMPSNHLILCCPLLLLPSIFSTFRVHMFFSGTDFLSSISDSLPKVFILTLPQSLHIQAGNWSGSTTGRERVTRSTSISFPPTNNSLLKSQLLYFWTRIWVINLDLLLNLEKWYRWTVTITVFSCFESIMFVIDGLETLWNYTEELESLPSC